MLELPTYIYIRMIIYIYIYIWILYVIHDGLDLKQNYGYVTTFVLKLINRYQQYLFLGNRKKKKKTKTKKVGKVWQFQFLTNSHFFLNNIIQLLQLSVIIILLRDRVSIITFHNLCFLYYIILLKVRSTNCIHNIFSGHFTRARARNISLVNVSLQRYVLI